MPRSWPIVATLVTRFLLLPATVWASGNLMMDGHFDEGMEDWPEWIGSVSLVDDLTGTCPSSRALSIRAHEEATFNGISFEVEHELSLTSQCLPVGDLVELELSYALENDSFDENGPVSTLPSQSLLFYDFADCTGGPTIVAGGASTAETYTVPAGVVAVQANMYLTAFVEYPFPLPEVRLTFLYRIDDVYLGPPPRPDFSMRACPIFRDGFESGDTSLWSSSQ